MTSPADPDPGAGCRPQANPAQGTSQDQPPASDGWTVDLDLDRDLAGSSTVGARPGPGAAGSGSGGAAGSDSAAGPVRLGRWPAAALALVLVAVSVVIWGPDSEPEAPPPTATVLGSHLAVPISLHLPAEAVATADGSYVGVHFPAGGAVLVTVPTEVVEPSGVRAPVPSDPAAWLAGHPSVFISRFRPVQVNGVAATQLDYRRSRMKAPPSRFARLPLFCGWRGESDVCTQITAAARVRATFLQIRGRTVLVEAVWRVDDTGTGRMPRALQRSYTALLAGLTPEPSRSERHRPATR